MVDVHRGRQARIVDLNAQDVVLHDNSPPLSVNRVAVVQRVLESLSDREQSAEGIFDQ